MAYGIFVYENQYNINFRIIKLIRVARLNDSLIKSRFDVQEY